jgi:hypothetical protein
VRGKTNKTGKTGKMSKTGKMGKMSKTGKKVDMRPLMKICAIFISN